MYGDIDIDRDTWQKLISTQKWGEAVLFTYLEHPEEHTMSETPAEEVNGGEDVQDKKSKKTAKHDGGVADLERVTDYAEEKELSSADISNVNYSHSLTSIL